MALSIQCMLCQIQCIDIPSFRITDSRFHSKGKQFSLTTIVSSEFNAEVDKLFFNCIAPSNAISYYNKPKAFCLVPRIVLA